MSFRPKQSLSFSVKRRSREEDAAYIKIVFLMDSSRILVIFLPSDSVKKKSFLLVSQNQEVLELFFALWFGVFLEVEQLFVWYWEFF